LGIAGLLARMVVFGLIGGFLVRAVYDYDATDAIGLDGALQSSPTMHTDRRRRAPRTPSSAASRPATGRSSRASQEATRRQA